MAQEYKSTEAKRAADRAYKARKKLDPNYLAEQAAYHRAYRASMNTHPEYLAKRRKWTQEYRERQRAKDPSYDERARTYAKDYGKYRIDVLDPLNKLAVVNVLTDGEGTCRWCGQGDIDVLCVDHIDNSGAEHRRRTKWATGAGMYLWLIRNGYPEGYQILCFNCNTKKELIYRRHLRAKRREEECTKTL